MKTFDSKDNSGWGSKVNFVDDNNVLVGFDSDSQCCENYGWFISDTVKTKAEEMDGEQPEELQGWNFDKAYFESDGGDGFDSGGVAIFRLVKDGQEKFLHLYNIHNGYYSHGFDCKVGGVVVHSGSL